MAAPTYAAGLRAPPAGIDALVSELSLGDGPPRAHAPARPRAAPRAVPAARPPALDLSSAPASAQPASPSSLPAPWSMSMPPAAGPRARPDSFYAPHPPRPVPPPAPPHDPSPLADRPRASPAHAYTGAASTPERHPPPSPAPTGSSSTGASTAPYPPPAASSAGPVPPSPLATNHDQPVRPSPSGGASTPSSSGPGSSSFQHTPAPGMTSTASLVPSRPPSPPCASHFGAGYQPARLASASRIFEQGSQVLRPGSQASLLSHEKTLELYRKNAKKVHDPELMYELAVFMIESSRSPESQLASASSHDRFELIKEALSLLRKISDRGHPDAQYFLADCYANGLGSASGKPQFDKAYPHFVQAAKHAHADAAYRAGICTERGWGCRKDSGKAVQFYRKAAAQGHPGAMFRLATAELNGELGLKKDAKEGVKWIKLSADMATPEFPHALHELALLHERGIDNVVFLDNDYACELLSQAAELGYAPSAYKLGVNYEYGKMGCAKDAGLSIHMYNIAAQQNHKEACFALCAWYLVGAPGILPQSDTEAYLWAKKAAEQGMAKAEYAVGYFTESGVGTKRNLPEAKAWYQSALEHGDKRASSRLASMGNIVASVLPKPPPPGSNVPPAARHGSQEAGKALYAYPQQGYQGSTARLPHAPSVSSSVGDTSFPVAGSGEGLAPYPINQAGQSLGFPVGGRFESTQSLPHRAASPASRAEKKKKEGWFR